MDFFFETQCIYNWLKCYLGPYIPINMNGLPWRRFALYECFQFQHDFMTEIQYTSRGTCWCNDWGVGHTIDRPGVDVRFSAVYVNYHVTTQQPKQLLARSCPHTCFLPLMLQVIKCTPFCSTVFHFYFFFLFFFWVVRFREHVNIVSLLTYLLTYSCTVPQTEQTVNDCTPLSGPMRHGTL